MKRPSKFNPPILAWLSLLACALLLTLGSRSYDNADAVVPVLCSQVHWTSSYWGQSRFGMLLPALAAPLSNFWTNYLTQSFLSSLALVGALVGAAGWLGFAGSPWLLAGCTWLVLLLTCSSESIYFLASLSQPYGVSLALLGCFWKVHQGRPRQSLGLLGLAFWLNYSLIPLQLALAVRNRQRAMLAGSVAVALVVSLLNRLNPAFISEEYRIVAPSFTALAELSRQFWDQCRGLLGCSALVVTWSLFSRRSPVILWALALAILHFSLASVSAWVAGNFFHFRYLMVSAVMLSLGVAVPICSLLSKREPFLWLALPLLVGLKFPGPTTQSLYPWAEQPMYYFELRQMGVTLLAGNYFEVYPMAYLEWGEGRSLYPLVHRGNVLRSKWEPLLRSGEPVAVEPGRWSELEFFLERVCEMSLEEGRWQTIARTSNLVVTRWNTTLDRSLPIVRAPVWSPKKDWRNYLGRGWHLDELDMTGRFFKEAELILNAPGPIRLQIAMRCQHPVLVTTANEHFLCKGNFTCKLHPGAQLITFKSTGPGPNTLTDIKGEDLLVEAPNLP